MENVRQDLAEKDMNKPMGMALDQRQEEIEPSCKNLIIGTHLLKKAKEATKAESKHYPNEYVKSFHGRR